MRTLFLVGDFVKPNGSHTPLCEWQAGGLSLLSAHKKTRREEASPHAGFLNINLVSLAELAFSIQFRQPSLPHITTIPQPEGIGC
jgi:hypothetical protein